MNSAAFACLAVCLAGGAMVLSGAIADAGVPASPLEALQAVVAAEAAQDWDSLLALTVSTDRADLAAFLANPRNSAANLGVFNVERASLAEVKELPEHIARGVTDLDRYRSHCPQVTVLYAGVLYQVRREDQFYYNGVNYRLAVLGLEDGAWRLAEFSMAPVQRLAAGDAAFGSATERLALEVEGARDRGLIINASGQVLGHLDSPAPPGTAAEAPRPPEGTTSTPNPTASTPAPATAPANPTTAGVSPPQTAASPSGSPSWRRSAVLAAGAAALTGAAALAAGLWWLGIAGRKRRLLSSRRRGRQNP